MVLKDLSVHGTNAGRLVGDGGSRGVGGRKEWHRKCFYVRPSWKLEPAGFPVNQMWSVRKDRLKDAPMLWPEKLDKWSCWNRKFFAKVRSHVNLQVLLYGDSRGLGSERISRNT